MLNHQLPFGQPLAQDGEHPLVSAFEQALLSKTTSITPNVLVVYCHEVTDTSGYSVPSGYLDVIDPKGTLQSDLGFETTWLPSELNPTDPLLGSNAVPLVGSPCNGRGLTPLNIDHYEHPATDVTLAPDYYGTWPSGSLCTIGACTMELIVTELDVDTSPTG